MATSTRGRVNVNGQKSGTFTCSHCPFRTTFKHSLKVHEEHHTVRHGFQCSLCTFSAVTCLGLKYHIERVHTDENKGVGAVSVPSDETEANLPDIFRGNHKENLLKHTSRLIQIVDAMTKEFQPEVAPNTDEPDEDSICRAELVKLAKDMKSAQVILMEAEKSLEEEAAARVQLDEIRKKVEELKTKGRSLSAKKAYLLELKERAQQQITELTGKQNQLDQELSELSREAPVNKKIKLDPFSSFSSLEEIHQKKATLSDVKTKLSVIEEEAEKVLVRINGVDQELSQNAVTLLNERVAQLNSLVTGNVAATGEPPSSVRLKALKREQLDRIAEFGRLQKKLFQISCGYVLGGICRLEDEFMKAVGVVDEN